jgi:circadian clock protein KaiB
VKKPAFFETTSVVELLRRGLIDTSQAFEKASADKVANPCTYVLRLYIAGSGAKSTRAIARVRALCERHMAGRYELEVIDLRQNPALARSARIVATPTLIQELPLPVRRFVGDMSDDDRILAGLEGKESKKRMKRRSPARQLCLPLFPTEQMLPGNPK